MSALAPRALTAWLRTVGILVDRVEEARSTLIARGVNIEPSEWPVSVDVDSLEPLSLRFSKRE